MIPVFTCLVKPYIKAYFFNSYTRVAQSDKYMNARMHTEVNTAMGGSGMLPFHTYR